MLAHFSLCAVSKSKVVIFGGATGDTGKYIITGDTYALDLISSKWSKLEGKKHTFADLIFYFVSSRVWYRTLTKSRSWLVPGRLTANGRLRWRNWR